MWGAYGLGLCSGRRRGKGVGLHLLQKAVEFEGLQFRVSFSGIGFRVGRDRF